MTRPSARSLALVALILWVCSLGLVGFTTTGRAEAWLGYEILFSGWLGFLDSTYAWFANPLLLWAVFAILKGRRANYSSCGALVLALDTLLTAQITVDEGGHTAPIYGLGWGAVLWGLAMSVLVAAAGTRVLELDASDAKSTHRAGLLRPLGLTISVALVAAAIGVNVHQRQVGNDNEKLVLSHIAYQRAPVCGAPDPSVTQPMRSLNAPLELRAISDGNIGPLGGPTTLLNWGIEIVRYEDRDYSLLQSIEGPMITSRPSSGQAAAVLDLSSQTHDDSMTIHVSLTDTATRRRVIDQTWTQLAPKTPMCPEFIDAPSPAEQPRKLIIQALSIGPLAADKFDWSDRSTFDRYWAVMGKRLQWQLVSRSSGDRGRQDITNCPADVGWGEQNTRAPSVGFDPFRINQTFFYHQDKFTVRFRCEGDRIYFYRSWADGNPGTFSIESRSLADFHLLWAGKIALELVGPDTQPIALQVRSATTSASGVKVDIVDPVSGKSVVVNLPDVI